MLDSANTMAVGWTCTCTSLGEGTGGGALQRKPGSCRVALYNALLRLGTQSKPQVAQSVPSSSSPHASAARNRSAHTTYRDAS